MDDNTQVPMTDDQASTTPSTPVDPAATEAVVQPVVEEPSIDEAIPTSVPTTEGEEESFEGDADQPATQE